MFLAQAVRRGEELDDRSEASRRSSEGKHRLAAELAAGRMTLREAAPRFRELNARFRDLNSQVLRTYRGASDEERFCQYAIAWTKTELAGKPEQTAVLARLRAEYRQDFGHDPAPLSGSPSRP